MEAHKAEENPFAAFESDAAMGEWMHAHLAKQYGFETRPAANPRGRRVLKRQVFWDRLRRVEAALQAGWPAAVQRRVEIVRMKEVNAFVAPGRYIYITSDLLERLPTDDSVALVIGHELAHAELGHLFEFRRRAIWRDLPAGDILALLVHALQRFAHSPENERDADAYGLDLTLKAGYDGEKCLEAFAVLEHYMLSKGAHHLVLGPECANRPTNDSFEEWKAKAELWIWERRHGYPALRERRLALQARLDQHRAGDGPPLVLPGSLQSAASVNAGFRARVRAIDEELEQWSAGLTAVATELADLLRTPVYRTLVSAVAGTTSGLDGRTAREVEQALATIQDVSRQTSALLDMLDRAREIRRFLSYDNPPQSALAELQGLLFGSLAPSDATAATFSRKPGSPSDTTTLRRLLDELSRVFASARQVVDAVDAAWTHWESQLAACREDFDVARQACHTLQLDYAASLDDLALRIASLERQTRADPLGVPADADRDLRAALTSLRAEILARISYMRRGR